MYTTSVTASNPTDDPAQLCGWFDSNADGGFDNSENQSSGGAGSAGERVCVTVPAGTTNGSFDLTWALPASERDNRGDFNFRYRISTDTDAANSPTGTASHGEVEDHQANITTLPITFASVDSNQRESRLYVEWTTATETRNIGFHLNGRGFDAEANALLFREHGTALTDLGCRKDLARHSSIRSGASRPSERSCPKRRRAMRATTPARRTSCAPSPCSGIRRRSCDPGGTVPVSGIGRNSGTAYCAEPIRTVAQETAPPCP